MNKFEFNKKYSHIESRNISCGRVSSSTRIQLMVWIGDNDPISQIICKISPSHETFAHIAAVNNSIIATSIAYSINCLNEVLCFKNTSRFDHIDILHTIPHFRKGGPPPQPTNLRHTLLCPNNVEKPQEILLWNFTEDPNHEDAHIEPLEITIEITSGN